MKPLIEKLGWANKAWVAGVLATLSQFSYVILENGQIMITPPADIADLVAKVGAVVVAVFAIPNLVPKKEEPTDVVEP